MLIHHLLYFKSIRGEYREQRGDKDYTTLSQSKVRFLKEWEASFVTHDNSFAMFSLLLAALASGTLLLCCLFYLSRYRRYIPLPPGPKGFPLIGNLWDVPVEYPWVTYARWTATYGDVFYLDTPGNPTVVINSAQAADDLLEKRSGNYSDRPGMAG